MQTLFERYQNKLQLPNSWQQKINQNQTLASKLQACLPHFMQDAILSAEIEQHTLTIMTPHAAWASRLRLQQAQLKQALSPLAIDQIHIMIAQQNSDTKRQLKKEKPSVSEENIETLAICAANLPDETLRNSIARLIKALESYSH